MPTGPRSRSTHPPEPTEAGHTAATGLDAADEAFRVLNAGTSRLVQLLTDELVPLAPATLADLEHTISQLQDALPDLAHWHDANPSTSDWILEPPFKRVEVHLTHPEDLEDVENVERLRRSFDLLAPQSLALRKETAILVVDALLHHLRRQTTPKPANPRSTLTSDDTTTNQ